MTATLYDGEVVSLEPSGCHLIEDSARYAEMCVEIRLKERGLVGKQVVARFDDDGLYYKVWRNRELAECGRCQQIESINMDAGHRRRG